MNEKQIFGKVLIDKAEQFLAQLNGNAIPQLAGDRSRAMAFLKKEGFPGPKAEEYKFTGLTKTIERGFDLIHSIATTIPLDMIKELRQKHDGANVLFFVNGEYQQEESVIVSDQSLLNIQPLAEFAAEHNDLSHISSNSTDPFAYQNAP